jgi:hypothetical protein
MDPGNEHIEPGPVTFDMSPVQTSAGPRLMMTIRTSSATVSVFLDRDTAKNVGNAITQAADQVSPLLVAPGPVANGHTRLPGRRAE